MKINKRSWLLGFWAACNLFAGNREKYETLRDEFLAGVEKI